MGAGFGVGKGGPGSLLHLVTGLLQRNPPVHLGQDEGFSTTVQSTSKRLI